MKLSFKQTLLIIILILTPVIISMLPFFIQSYMSPTDRVFTGLHRWSEDYYGYLQSINQGLMGHITNVSKLTLQPHQPTFVHSEYVLLGFVGRFFGLNSPLVYHLSRLFLGAVFVFVAFYFFYYLFKPYTVNRIPYAVVAFFLAFFVGGFPRITSWQPLLVEPYLAWWTELDVLTRSTILPHYLMGNIFFLLVIILFLKIMVGMTRKKDLFLLALFSFLLAFVHPIDFLILLCSLGTFVGFQFILNFFFRFKISLIRQIGLIIIVFVSGLLPALYYRYALSLPFWRFILAHGTTTIYNIPLFDLTMALGPVFVIGVIGIFVFLAARLTNFLRSRYVFETERTLTPEKNFVRRASQETEVSLLLFSWLFVQSLFFLKFYQILNFDRLRTMEAPFYLALAFFAAVFLIKMYKVVILSERSESKDLTQIKSVVKDSSTKFIPSVVEGVGMTKEKILLITMTVLVLISTLPTTLILFHNQIFALSDFKTFSLFSYPTIKQYQAWQFLRDHTPDNSAVTTLYEEKFLLPTVSGNKIAFGANFDNDKNYQNNVNKINQMYTGLLSASELQKFLYTNNIKYVYWGYQEQSLDGDLTKYPFLQKIFSNGEVVIFKVK